MHHNVQKRPKVKQKKKVWKNQQNCLQHRCFFLKNLPPSRQTICTCSRPVDLSCHCHLVFMRCISSFHGNVWTSSCTFEVYRGRMPVRIQVGCVAVMILCDLLTLGRLSLNSMAFSFCSLSFSVSASLSFLLPPTCSVLTRNSRIQPS